MCILRGSAHYSHVKIPVTGGLISTLTFKINLLGGKRTLRHMLVCKCSVLEVTHVTYAHNSLVITRHVTPPNLRGPGNSAFHVPGRRGVWASVNNTVTTGVYKYSISMCNMHNFRMKKI